MSALLKRLLAYLRLGVEPEGDEPLDPTAGGGDDTLDDLLDDVEPKKAGETETIEEDPAAELAKERKATKEARDDLERERAARRDAEARAQPPARAGADPDYEREEQQLAAAKAKGENTEMLEWTIRSNRLLRESNRNSQGALNEARDLRDQTDFERLQTTHPKTFKAYKDRVDEVVAKARNQGQQPAPRRMILAYLLGQDSLDGKIKPKAAPAERTEGRVDRGKTPGARTDVRYKGGLTEAQKRKERLRNTYI